MMTRKAATKTRSLDSHSATRAFPHFVLCPTCTGAACSLVLPDAPRSTSWSSCIPLSPALMRAKQNQSAAPGALAGSICGAVSCSDSSGIRMRWSISPNCVVCCCKHPGSGDRAANSCSDCDRHFFHFPWRQARMCHILLLRKLSRATFSPSRFFAWVRSPTVLFLLLTLNVPIVCLLALATSMAYPRSAWDSIHLAMHVLPWRQTLGNGGCRPTAQASVAHDVPLDPATKSLRFILECVCVQVPLCTRSGP